VRSRGGGTVCVDPEHGYPGDVIILGVILLILGFALGISVLWTIGIILVVIGAILWILGTTGHEIAGRRHYY
jgi:hypothetical protein